MRKKICDPKWCAWTKTGLPIVALCHKSGAELIKGVGPMTKQFKTLREKIAYENIERLARYAAWDKLFSEAIAAA